MSIFRRKKSRGASNRLLPWKREPDKVFGGPDSIGITPWFEENYGSILDDETQFMEETRLREAQTISNFQPFGGNADTRLNSLSEGIYGDEELVTTTGEVNNTSENENDNITNEEQNEKNQGEMVTAMVGAASQAIEGLTGVVSGLVGQRQRKAEARAAKRDFENTMADFRAIDTSNPFANIQNTYEDLTVNQQQAQFEAQQQQLGMATAMGQMRGAAGSSGIAAMAQAMANQQSVNLQKSAASIGMQESRNQALAAQGAERRETMLAKGEQESRRMEFAKQEQLLGLTSDRKIAADEAVAAAKQSMISGVGNLLGGAASGMIGMGAEGKGPMKDWF